MDEGMGTAIYGRGFAAGVAIDSFIGVVKGHEG